MGLESAIQGARHTGQQITWIRTDGTPQNLTGATLTGRITPVMGPASMVKDIDGILAVVTPPTSGVLTWTYGVGDVSEWGTFEVQFKATYSDGTYDLSNSEAWMVAKAA